MKGAFKQNINVYVEDRDSIGCMKCLASFISNHKSLKAL